MLLIIFWFKVSFKGNDKALSKNIIGKISCNFSNLKDKIKIGAFKSVSLNVKPFEICTLPNGHLISVNSEPKCITVYDMKKDFELVKRFDKIGALEIGDFHVTTNNLDKIYFSDSKKHRIFLTNFNFNILKEFGSKGINADEFDTPQGLCFYNNFVYLCDSKNKRIVMLDENLSTSRVFCKLDFIPWQIKISFFSACIKEMDTDRVFFFNMYAQSLEYDRFDKDSTGPICSTNIDDSKFHVSLAKKNHNSFEIKFYNAFGDLDERIKIKHPYLIEYGVDQLTKIDFYNQNLIISLLESQKLLII